MAEKVIRSDMTIVYHEAESVDGYVVLGMVIGVFLAVIAILIYIAVHE